MRLKKLFKATAVMGVSTLVAIIAGLIRAKMLALFLGPSGMGVLSQVLTFTQSAETICGLGIGIGITKYVSEVLQKKETGELPHIIITSMLLQIVSCGVLLFFVILFLKPLSQFIFSTTKYSWVLMIATLAVLFSVLIVSLESVFLGMKKPEQFSKTRILYYSVGLVMLIVFLTTMKLTGAFFYVIINAIVSFLIVLFFLRRALLKAGHAHIFSGLHWPDIKKYSTKLFSFGFIMLAATAVTWCTILFVRSKLIEYSGVQANGFYQVIFALVSYYVPFFTNGLWGYLFPQLSGQDNTNVINNEMNRAFRFIMFFLVPALGVFFLLRHWIVLAVFTEEFLPAVPLFAPYLLGSFFFVIWHVMLVYVLAKKRLRYYLGINILYNFLFATLFMGIITRQPGQGVTAIAISYLVVNMIMTIMTMVYEIRNMGLRLHMRTIKFFAWGFLVMWIIFLSPLESSFMIFLKGLLIVAWFAFVFTIGKEERLLFRSFIKR